MPVHTLMFGWEYPPAHCGGLGVACQGIVRGLLHHGARVTLVLPHDQALEDGVDVIFPTEEHKRSVVIPISSVLHPYDSVQSYAERFATLESQASSGIANLYGINLAEEVERFTALAVEMTKSVTPTIVHTHDWMTLDAGRRASKYHRKPLVAHVHATELDRTEFHPNEWIYERERVGLLASDHVIAVSNYTKQLLVSEYGIPEDKITVLHNGTFETHQFAPDSERTMRRHPLVLFLGRLTVQKGPLYFLRAARQVAELQSEVRFVIAGEGYLLPELISTACDMGLADRVIFAGRVTSDEAVSLYKHADCFVMPSVSEPFGLVALEAITHGAPVVLSKQSGASEVVSNSFVVDFWDTEKMADCILTVLRERPLRDQMRSQSPRILSHLNWHRQAAKIMDIYHRLIG